jgi:hypothetical protein
VALGQVMEDVVEGRPQRVRRGRRRRRHFQLTSTRKQRNCTFLDF